MKKTPYESGFSLVELSIVLVILGLLVGGVLGGQSLIRAAELRSITQEVQQWQSAVHQFRYQYQALPGDFRLATRFWREAQGNICDAVAANTHRDALEGGTCNGNGDGRIGWAYPGNPGYYETFLFWQHLQLSGMQVGQFSGVSGAKSSYDYVAGYNAPAARYGTGTVWSARTVGDEGSAHVFFATPYGHFLAMGRPQEKDGHPWEVIMTPAEAWSLDSKWDDGKPAQGNVIAYLHSNNCTTAAGNSDLNADYQLEVAEVRCGVIFANAF